MHIGKNIKYLRKRQGMTAEELADILEKSRHAVTQYETGRSVPPLEVASQIASYFHVSLDQLLGEDLTIASPNTTEEKETSIQRQNDLPLWDYRALIAKVQELEERIDTITGVGK